MPKKNIPIVVHESSQANDTLIIVVSTWCEWSVHYVKEYMDLQIWSVCFKIENPDVCTIEP